MYQLVPVKLMAIGDIRRAIGHVKLIKKLLVGGFCYSKPVENSH